MILAIRASRRRKIFFTAVSLMAVMTVSCFALFKFKGEAIKRSLIYFIEDKTSASLGIKITVESVRLSMLGPVVLKGFKAVKETQDDTPFVFKSDKFIIYNNIARIFIDRYFRKLSFKGTGFAFKIENGYLYKGDKQLLQNIAGSGRIVNSNLFFDDVSGRGYSLPVTTGTLK
ncbi:MAG: hypothetical protein COW11_06050 [Candidatus Omnitrophica bacterium CG12_big_fil_rev_8_21_14_0_65_43_15]|uniref:Uncharacterized protein n=1 Tax=Candidatus Taenaricola geysiri TaxID=1974752 RepID=A0A2J0LGD8_9BACT|nr:MAG: hypothetical protein AUJ89_03010 [Candidatus Omnitrophica bacterium CG1_02_43_210]PIR65257.1 MAG: hypothetical protein COU52_05220 [Candidatus Omnitrophica bacterium CG10_big_fil_rev_8_21_14_0_10_43_8]PIV12220.1 MAG: hypothetical protein COS48_01970 [Candidatus Omnitrophica bacterium CG03_land_8_20_14_0_80_43_22]PIW65934.1 MAG: hypothetical protein COW11_06050 [Candidatus Omnitrophica bacterium CG12_big_fil_rev_8_21_14_0_65_43_15]PIW79923.1 MAG: hypothetical protein COZ98_05015 [Candida